METIEEIKQHVNKPAQRFTCRVLHRDPGHLILAYTSPSEGKISDIIIPADSVTIAHYRTETGYVLWRMFDSARLLVGTLFHVCRDITIQARRVSYLDLIVDVWVSPDGKLRVLDEDELISAQQKGLLAAQDPEHIAQWRDTVLADHEQIIAKAIGEERRAGISPEVL